MYSRRDDRNKIIPGRIGLYHCAPVLYLLSFSSPGLRCSNFIFQQSIAGPGGCYLSNQYRLMPFVTSIRFIPLVASESNEIDAIFIWYRALSGHLQDLQKD